MKQPFLLDILKEQESRFPYKPLAIFKTTNCQQKHLIFSRIVYLGNASAREILIILGKLSQFFKN